jgi:hypothetical protein
LLHEEGSRPECLSPLCSISQMFYKCVSSNSNWTHYKYLRLIISLISPFKQSYTSTHSARIAIHRHESTVRHIAPASEELYITSCVIYPTFYRHCTCISFIFYDIFKHLATLYFWNACYLFCIHITQTKQMVRDFENLVLLNWSTKS